MPEDEKAAESSSVEVPEVEKGTSAETQNTDPESTKGENENPVPQSRFTEVVDERNDLREKLGALKSSWPARMGLAGL